MAASMTRSQPPKSWSVVVPLTRPRIACISASAIFPLVTAPPSVFSILPSPAFRNWPLISRTTT